jgi:hypothetical protein
LNCRRFLMLYRVPNGVPLLASLNLLPIMHKIESLSLWSLWYIIEASSTKEKKSHVNILTTVWKSCMSDVGISTFTPYDYFIMVHMVFVAIVFYVLHLCEIAFLLWLVVTTSYGEKCLCSLEFTMYTTQIRSMILLCDENGVQAYCYPSII